MPTWMRELQQRWTVFWSAGQPLAPFGVACRCGQPLQGYRAARAQSVRCPNCGAPVFILARSPLPVLGEDGVPLPPAAAPRWSPWLVPLGAAFLTLCFVGVGFFWLIALLTPVPLATEPAPPDVTAEAIRMHSRRGQALLAEGNFREANKVYLEANELRLRAPHLLTVRETRQFQQQQRQADLLGHLLLLTLEEVVHHGQRSRAEEWLEQFNEFKGRTVIFDDVVIRERPHSRLQTYQVRSARETARVELNLDILDKMEPQLPRRLLFGARLASVQRDRDRGWVIRFEPGSGVLLTDEGAVAACGLAPLPPDVKELLRWQADWIENNP